MFTGIIQSVGIIISSFSEETGSNLKVTLGTLDQSKIHVGDSISVNGVCLTISDLGTDFAQFHVSNETLRTSCINQWQQGRLVNLEPALRLNQPLGGHFVLGHVDNTAVLLDRIKCDECTHMRFQIPNLLGKFIAKKGSISINGVSLTINTVCDIEEHTIFEVMIIPYTLSNTTLGDLVVGSTVCIEIDIVSRYLSRLIDMRSI